MNKKTNPINKETTRKKPRIKKAVKLETEIHTKWFEEYTSIITGKKTIIGPFMEDLIKEMLGYVNDNIDATIMKFLSQKGIPYKTFDEWCKKYPELDDAYDQFNMSIADNIERKARERNDIGFSIRSMSYYSKKWRKFDEERQASKTGDTGPQTIVVEIPSIKDHE